MSKGFILVDIPETCLDCRFCFEIHEGIEACCDISDSPNDPNLMREIDVSYPNEKPNWCPIRQLPKKDGIHCLDYLEGK